MQTTVTIDPRFCGPPDSGNGGYVCGLIGKQADFVADVYLRVPPPLSKSLILAKENGHVTLMDGDTLVGEAKPGELTIDAPEPPDFESATEASKNYIGFEGHVFPTCFVCGPDRGHDALRIFAGRVDGKEIVAAPWIPDDSLGDEQGYVTDEFHWAALDCPGYFAITDTPRKSVLGKMTAQVVNRVKPGEQCIVIGWPIEHDGRKHFSGTAIYAGDGSLSAIAHAIWIDI